MSNTLKKLCEIALAREFSKVPALRAITPKIWDSDAIVRQPFLNIQATPAGEEMVWRCGIYMVDCQVRLEGKPRRGMNLAEKMAFVDGVFLELAQLDANGLSTRFAGTGIFVHGVIPRQMAAALEGDNRVDVSACALVAHVAI